MRMVISAFTVNKKWNSRKGNICLCVCVCVCVCVCQCIACDYGSIQDMAFFPVSGFLSLPNPIHSCFCVCVCVYVCVCVCVYGCVCGKSTCVLAGCWLAVCVGTSV